MADDYVRRLTDAGDAALTVTREMALLQLAVQGAQSTLEGGSKTNPDYGIEPPRLPSPLKGPVILLHFLFSSRYFYTSILDGLKKSRRLLQAFFKFPLTSL